MLLAGNRIAKLIKKKQRRRNENEAGTFTGKRFRVGKKYDPMGGAENKYTKKQ